MKEAKNKKDDWVCPHCTKEEECAGCWMNRTDWERVFPQDEY
jgi:hypothetical protein